MPIETFLSLLLFCFVAAASPGPNNTMLFASGVNFGFSRTLPHMAGITIGFTLMVLCVGLGLGAVLERYPVLLVVLKVVGGLYLLWIAWKIGTARKVPEADAEVENAARPFTFLQAASFQWVNPKAWVMILGAIAAFSDHQRYLLSVFLIAASFFLVSFLSTSAWAGFGTALRGWLSDPVRLKWFNITMAVILVVSLWPMLR